LRTGALLSAVAGSLMSPEIGKTAIVLAQNDSFCDANTEAPSALNFDDQAARLFAIIGGGR